MNRYTKIIGITGAIYVKEFEKIKHHKNKLRTVTEDTVVKMFKQGDTEVVVYLEETDQELIIDAFSDEENIKRYLGKRFL